MLWLSRGVAGSLLAGAGRLLLVLAVIASSLIPIPAFAADQPQVAAKYAVVVDASSGEILYDKGMNTATAPASLTKVFTAIAALDAANLDREVPIDQYDLVGEASMGLQAGQNVSLRTLLNGLLLGSGNDAAMAIARNVGALAGDTPQQSINRFMTRVNSLSERLGLTGTHLTNPHGLDQAGHQSTARDLAAITMYALKNQDFRTIVGTPSYNREGFELYQANLLLGAYPGLIGGKTGYTETAGYCLLEAAERDGHTIIAVLLNSTKDAWYQDATILLDYGFEAVSAPADSARPTISLSPAPVAASAMTAASSPRSVNGVTIERLDATTAVVRSTTGVSESGAGVSWRWPLTALIAMVIALGLALNGHTLIGIASLLWQNRPKVSLPARSAAAPAMVPVTTGQPEKPAPSVTRRAVRYNALGYVVNDRPATFQSFPSSQFSVTSRATGGHNAATPSAGEGMACGAVKLALRGRYQEASGEFVRALRSDPGLDLSRCPGFWQMGPAGLAAAVRAYRICDRPDDARTLLTIVQLSVGSDRELERLQTRSSVLAG
jgi:D-alanyl-D-alanine carboxypeptidase (penicillin-binding protein 5/6)